MNDTLIRAARFGMHVLDDVLYPRHCLMSGVPLFNDTRLPEIDNDVLDALPPAPSPVELMLMAQRHVGADDLHIASFHSLWAVDDHTEKAMYAIKYKGRTSLALAMGAMLGAVLADDGVTADVIVPVPIHKTRRRERGYNQAEFIARGLAKSLMIPVATSMRRNRYTGTQTSLSEQQRLTNVVDAFEVVDTEPTHRATDRGVSVRGARVLLVDDVLTTGSTLNACAYALLNAGARRVDACTLCAA